MEHLNNSPHPRKHSAFRHDAFSPKEFSRLETTRRKELIEDTALDTMTALAKAGYEEYDNITEMYRNVSFSDLLVRREDPERVIKAVSENLPLTISFPDGSRYSNAVELDPSIQMESIGNAFLEGYGIRNGIVTVIGMMKHDALDVQKLPDATQNFYGLSRQQVVSMHGTVEPEHIAFVLIRVPNYAFPAELMTEKEQERFQAWEDRDGHKEPEFIFRGYLNPRTSLKRVDQ